MKGRPFGGRGVGRPAPDASAPRKEHAPVPSHTDSRSSARRPAAAVRAHADRLAPTTTPPPRRYIYYLRLMNVPLPTFVLVMFCGLCVALYTLSEVVHSLK